MHWPGEPVELFDRVTEIRRRVAFARWKLARQEAWLRANADAPPSRIAQEELMLESMRASMEEVLKEECAILADANRKPGLAEPARLSDRPVARSGA